MAQSNAVTLNKVLNVITSSFQSKLTDVSHTSRRLIHLADFATTCRQGEVIRRISKVLSEIPLPQNNRGVSQYYQALAINNFGDGNVDEAARRLENVLDEAPVIFKARGMLSLGTCLVRLNQKDLAYKLYTEAQRVNAKVSDSLLSSFLSMNVAYLLSADGNHNASLKILESIHPFMRTLAKIYPNQYCNYLNSFANELLEAGRIKEALYYIRVALASPFAFAYPEWHETGREVAQSSLRASKSVVSVGIDLSRWNVFDMPLDRPHVESVQTKAGGLGRVESITEWIMPKKNTEKIEEAEDDLDLEDRAILHGIIADPKLTRRKELRRFLKLWEEIQKEKQESGQK
jgi:tetratricopeptide (TPR) repeat protein